MYGLLRCKKGTNICIFRYSYPISDILASFFTSLLSLAQHHPTILRIAAVSPARRAAIAAAS